LIPWALARGLHCDGRFAACLRANVRTLQNWDQGWARPNAQDALPINLVRRRYPDTV
jgi:putative transcriptional regulator